MLSFSVSLIVSKSGSGARSAREAINPSASASPSSTNSSVGIGTSTSSPKAVAETSSRIKLPIAAATASFNPLWFLQASRERLVFTENANPRWINGSVLVVVSVVVFVLVVRVVVTVVVWVVLVFVMLVVVLVWVLVEVLVVVVTIWLLPWPSTMLKTPRKLGRFCTAVTSSSSILSSCATLRPAPPFDTVALTTSTDAVGPLISIAASKAF